MVDVTGRADHEWTHRRHRYGLQFAGSRSHHGRKSVTSCAAAKKLLPLAPRKSKLFTALHWHPTTWNSAIMSIPYSPPLPARRAGYPRSGWRVGVRASVKDTPLPSSLEVQHLQHLRHVHLESPAGPSLSTPSRNHEAPEPRSSSPSNHPPPTGTAYPPTSMRVTLSASPETRAKSSLGRPISAP